jgi:hypothetical protein
MPILTGYHATAARMDRAPTEFRAFKGIDYGPGFYFATDPRDTAYRGRFVHEAEVELNNPIVFSATKTDETALRRFKRAFSISDEDLSHDGPPLVQAIGLVKTLVDMGMYSAAQIHKWMMKLGYDGVYVENNVLTPRLKGTHGDYFAIFTPQQILSWKPLDKNYQLEPNTRKTRRSSGRRGSRRR